MAVMVGKWKKKLRTIRVNLLPNPSEGTNLLLYRFLPFTYHHSHFLAANLEIISYLIGAAPFYTAWLFWIILSYVQ